MGENKVKNIHWFPGHMKKASNKLEEKLKLVDFVIVVLDARAPYSTFNNYLINIVKEKRKLYLLNKADLVDENSLSKWVNHFNKNGDEALAVSLTNNKYKNIIFSKINDFCMVKEEKYLKKGIKKVNSRAMVIGIPNVGKSTLINLLAGKKLQGAANTPGYTKSLNWAKINDNLELLDTPGILEPQFESKEQAINLALIGAIKDTILPTDELANYCLDYLKKEHKNEIQARFNIVFEDDSNISILEMIAKKRGFILKGNELDLDKSMYILLKEFKDGLICKYCLDELC